MIIVEHKASKHHFILIGTGYGHAQSCKPSFLFGALLPDHSEDTHLMVCVCDRKGRLGWCPSEDVRLISVDGIDVNNVPNVSTFEDLDVPADQPTGRESAAPMRCAICNRVLESDVCPHCN